VLELVVRPLARRDLKAIWTYTVQQWGKAQADQYLYDLAREMQELLKFPDLARPTATAAAAKAIQGAGCGEPGERAE
jgi:plasmid stabilization system protein ParE